MKCHPGVPTGIQGKSKRRRIYEMLWGLTPTLPTSRDRHPRPTESSVPEAEDLQPSMMVNV